jgi:hypothetical protein
MNPIQGLVLRVTSLVVGSMVVGASIASNPATAQNVNSMVQEFTNTVCSKTTVCKKFTNNGSGAGVEGVGGNGSGVIAQSTNGSATLSTSTNADGVQAYSNNFDGINSGTNNNSSLHSGRSGVWGHDDSTDGGTLNAGVTGSSLTGAGISGSSYSDFGVFGTSPEGFGVRGYSKDGGGGYFKSDGNFVTLVAESDATPGYPFLAYSLGGRVYEDGSGNFYATGAMYATSFNVDSDVVTNDGRHVMSYASRSADAEMSDVGTGRIVNGHGIVRLDPAFARTLDMRSGYHVFLTPMGDSKGLYIASKSPTGFEVRESQGGVSTISFDYRIVGQSLGATLGRLPAVRISVPRIRRGQAPGRDQMR